MENQNKRKISSLTVKAIKVWLLFALGISAFALVILAKYQLTKYQTTLVWPTDQNSTEVLGTFTSAAKADNSFQQPPLIVYGFLPYWTIQKAQVSDHLTHVGYFSISVDSAGNFITKTDEGTEMGWYRYHSSELDQLREQTQEQKQKLEILITMMDADEISKLLTTRSSKDNFLKNLRQFVKTQPVDGINIDIEYAGTVTDQLRSSYTQLLSEIKSQLTAVDPNIHLSIDVFADSAVKYRIWDIEAVAPHVDHIVIMAYDFFRKSSPMSGPISPVFGSEKNRWETDIMENLKAFLEKAPSEKIILGIPFYGYEWQTISEEPGSATLPKTGALATYSRVQNLIKELEISEQWDNDALSPYVTYKEQGRIQTIFYENSRSLSYKLDLVNQAGLGGIAIWAMGYEGDTQELWDVIGEKTIQRD